MAGNVRIETTPSGEKYLVRRPFRPEDYTVPDHMVSWLAGWARHQGSVDELRALHDGPFRGWNEVERYEKDGRRWVVLHSADYFVEAEVVEGDMPVVRAVDPRRAYELARMLDGKSRVRVVHE